eukprot:TRINITY_DN10467_c0_g4_i1.p1 TRINITY_DN10467_c0_g4~~TRINITY_DN10467_c0_g4_i1.p1  ORF type:complete len:500 (-),score=76.16 TRINITY_DN10467_c0_g4_i1:15-1514(-)
MNETAKNDIVYCYRTYKSRETLRLQFVATAKMFPRRRLLKYESHSKVMQKRDLSHVKYKNTRVASVLSVLNSNRDDKIANARLLNVQKRRTKFYLERLLLRKNNAAGNIKPSPSLFTKLQEMYSVHDAPAKKVPRLKAIEHRFPEQKKQQSFSLIEKPIVDTSWNIDLSDLPDFSNDTRTVTEQMRFMNGLRKTEEGLNDHIHKLKSKLNTLTKDVEAKKSATIKEYSRFPRVNSKFAFSPAKLRAGSFARKKSCKKLNVSIKKALNISTAKPSYLYNGPVEKFVRLIVKSNPLLSILSWTLECPYSLLRKENVLTYLRYCISERARPVALHSNPAMATLDIDCGELSENQGRAVARMLKHFPDTVTGMTIKVPELADNSLKELLVGVESSKTISALAIEGAQVEFKSLAKLKEMLKLGQVVQLALENVSFNNFHSLIEDTAILLKLEKFTLSKFKCSDVSIDHFVKLMKASRNIYLSLIHICRCRRYAVCRSRWSPYH